MDKIDGDENIARKHIGIDNLNQSPTITMIGITESSSPYSEIGTFIEKTSKEIYPILAEHGLKKMNGTGWEKISKEPDFETMKLAYYTPTPILQSEIDDDVIDQNIFFTGARLCDTATYIESKAIQEEFPDVKLRWMTIKTNMAEEQKGPLMPHHILVIESDKVDYRYFLDMVYGQVKFGEGVLFAPFKTLEKWYPDIEVEKIIPIEEAWDNYEMGLKDDIALQKVTENTVPNLTSK